VQTIFLWNTKNLGYLTVYAGTMLSRNQIPAGAASIQAGRLGTLVVKGSELILGAPLLIDRKNIDKLDF
jgi:rhamnose transport system permease protein